MAWSLGNIVNNYAQPVLVSTIVSPARSVSFASTPLNSVQMNVIIPGKGTLIFLDRGLQSGSPGNNLVEAYFKNADFGSYTEVSPKTVKLEVTIDINGTPTVRKV